MWHRCCEMSWFILPKRIHIIITILLMYKKNIESFLFWIVSSHCWCVDKRCYQLRRIIEYAKKNELRCISWHIWITWTSRYILLHASYCSISSFQAPILNIHVYLRKSSIKTLLFDKAYFLKYFVYYDDM